MSYGFNQSVIVIKNYPKKISSQNSYLNFTKKIFPFIMQLFFVPDKKLNLLKIATVKPIQASKRKLTFSSFSLFFFIFIIQLYIRQRFMGNTSCKGQIDDFLQQYKELRREHGALVLTDRSGENHYIVKEFSFADKSQFQNELNKLNGVQNSFHNQNVLSLLKYYTKQFNNFCSNTYKIYSVYEYSIITLADEISARKDQSKYFEECQLWAILQSCVNGLESVKPVLSLHPQNIFIGSDGGLKIMSNDIIKEDHRFIVESKVYYAPEKIRNFHKPDSQNSLKKQMLFSLGMTLLHACLLKPMNNCYNYENFEFNEKELESNIQILLERYSQQLVQMLSMILEPNQSRRATLEEIKELLTQIWNVEDSKQSSSIVIQQTKNESESCSEIGKSRNQNMKKTKEEYETLKINDDKENLFTDPKLLQMIRNDLKSISQRQVIPENILKQKNEKVSQPIMKKSLQRSFSVKKVEEEGVFVIQDYEDGRKFQGIIVDNKMNGPGKLTYPDGAYYEGQFVNGLMQGKGTLYYGVNRPAYEGDWMEDKFQGYGILYNDNPFFMNSEFNYENFDTVDDYWIKYEGWFKNDCKEGEGKFTLSNGEEFHGQFKNDEINGKGCYTTRRKEKVEGTWSSNMLLERIK